MPLRQLCAESVRDYWGTRLALPLHCGASGGAYGKTRPAYHRFAAMAIASFPTTEAVAGDVNVGVHIGIPVPPPPRIVLPAPPAVVVVPNTQVSYAPNVDFNLFVYGGRYYTFHDGSWFYATRHSGPWAFIATERVPRPVVGVPMKYYKVPPGHADRKST